MSVDAEDCFTITLTPYLQYHPGFYQGVEPLFAFWFRELDSMRTLLFLDLSIEPRLSLYIVLFTTSEVIGTTLEQLDSP